MTTRTEPWPDGTPNWIDLAADDVEAAASFYSSLFGWTISDTGEEGGHYRLAALDGVTVAGIGPKSNPQQPTAWLTYFAVDDAGLTAEKVSGEGGTVWVAPFDVLGLGIMSINSDPSGAAFATWQSTGHIGAGKVNEPGTLTWNELYTPDFDKVKSFYTQVFGFDYTASGSDGVVYETAQLDGKDVAGFYQFNELPEGVPPYWLTWFRVADTDASYRQAIDLGASSVTEPNDIEQGRIALLQGPGGEQFGIIAWDEAA